jgi:hypothetical protein
LPGSPWAPLAAGGSTTTPPAPHLNLEDHAPDVDLRPDTGCRRGRGRWPCRQPGDGSVVVGALADPEGNEACVTTWIGTAGRGYP